LYIPAIRFTAGGRLPIGQRGVIGAANAANLVHTGSRCIAEIIIVVAVGQQLRSRVFQYHGKRSNTGRCTSAEPVMDHIVA